MKHFLIVAATCVLTSAVADAKEECPIGAALDVRDVAFFTCMQRAQSAYLMSASAPECVTQIRKDGIEAFERAKGCMKKKKNLEGLRALGEYYAAWQETINETRGGTSRSIELKWNEARKRWSVLEALN